MDFVRYAESAAALLNAELADVADLVEHLADRAWLHDQVTERDVEDLVAFRTELRPLFVASEEERVGDVVRGLNELLARHPITPMISDHDPADLHLHVANRAATPAQLLVGESLMGLASVVCDLGASRMGVCSASPCTHVYVDTSPNSSRRYCSDRCSSRANVAAYRARQKAAAL